jgi:hypothetical protein
MGIVYYGTLFLGRSIEALTLLSKPIDDLLPRFKEEGEPGDTPGEDWP